MKTINVSIEGMSCMHCSATVQNAINRIDGATAVVSLKDKKATVTCKEDLDTSLIEKAVSDAGYKVTGIK